MSIDDQAGKVPCGLFMLSGVGLNLAPSIYFAYVNVYAATSDSSLLAWMSLSVMGAALMFVILGLLLDDLFDRRYGSKSSYSFRIGVGLLGLGILLIAVPFATRQAQVSCLGVCIGAVSGWTLASLNQLASVVDTSFTKYVATGMTIGQALPIPLSLMLDFDSANASHEARVMFAWLPAALCLFTFVIFCLVTLCYGIFDTAFAKMDDSFQSVECADAHEAAPLLNSSSSVREAGAIEAMPSCWLQWPVSGCAAMQFVSNFLAMFLMQFFTYYGSLGLAHDLILVRFGGEFVGRVASHYIRLWDAGLLNGKGLVGLFFMTGTRALIVFVLVMGVFGQMRLTDMRLVFGLVGFIYILFAWSGSELLVLVAEVGPQKKKVDLMRGMTLLMLGGQIMSSATALVLIQFLHVPYVRFS